MTSISIAPLRDATQARSAVAPSLTIRQAPRLGISNLRPLLGGRSGHAIRPGDTAVRQYCHGVAKLKLDLHDIYNRGDQIDRALREVIDEAVRRHIPLVEIIPGKGSGQLKKRVLRFLDQKEVRALYHRVEKDSDNFGRIFVHFRWK